MRSDVLHSLLPVGRPDETNCSNLDSANLIPPKNILIYPSKSIGTARSIPLFFMCTEDIWVSDRKVTIRRKFGIPAFIPWYFHVDVVINSGQSTFYMKSPTFQVSKNIEMDILKITLGEYHLIFAGISVTWHLQCPLHNLKYRLYWVKVQWLTFPVQVLPRFALVKSFFCVASVFRGFALLHDGASTDEFGCIFCKLPDKIFV